LAEKKIALVHWQLLCNTAIILKIPHHLKHAATLPCKYCC